LRRRYTQYRSSGAVRPWLAAYWSYPSEKPSRRSCARSSFISWLVRSSSTSSSNPAASSCAMSSISAVEDFHTPCMGRPRPSGRLGARVGALPRHRAASGATDDVLAAELGDLGPERLEHGWLPRQLGDRRDAPHAPRRRRDRHAHACALGLQHERPVAAGGGLEGRDSTVGPERDVVDRAERVVAGAEEKGARAGVAGLDHRAGSIGDEHVLETAP